MGIRNYLSMAVIGHLLTANAAVAGDIPSVGDLARIQAETVLIRAQAKREEAQAELAARRPGGMVTAGTLPVLKSIFGTEARLTARFMYPGSVTVEAGEGELLPGGYRVSRILPEASRVELMKGKETFPVGFSITAPAARQQVGQGQNPGLQFVPGLAR